MALSLIGQILKELLDVGRNGRERMIKAGKINYLQSRF